MASGGNGPPSHVAGELFNMIAGVNIVHVPYQCLQHPLSRNLCDSADDEVIPLMWP